MTDLPEIQLASDQPVDVDSLMRQIRAHIIARRNVTRPASDVTLPSYEGRLDAAIYEQLYHATLVHDQISLSLNVVPSSMPIMGPFITLLRRKLHELVVYYVNQLAQKQIVFNRNILGAINGLVQEIERLSPSDLDAVRQDLEALRQQMSARSEHQ